MLHRTPFLHFLLLLVPTQYGSPPKLVKIFSWACNACGDKIKNKNVKMSPEMER